MLRAGRILTTAFWIRPLGKCGEIHHHQDHHQHCWFGLWKRRKPTYRRVAIPLNRPTKNSACVGSDVLGWLFSSWKSCAKRRSLAANQGFSTCSVKIFFSFNEVSNISPRLSLFLAEFLVEKAPSFKFWITKRSVEHPKVLAMRGPNNSPIFIDRSIQDTCVKNHPKKTRLLKAQGNKHLKKRLIWMKFHLKKTNVWLYIEWIQPIQPPNKKKTTYQLSPRFYVDYLPLWFRKKKTQKLRLRPLRSDSWPFFLFGNLKISWSQPTPWRIKLPREVN